jgi:hypothetical protein
MRLTKFGYLAICLISMTVSILSIYIGLSNGGHGSMYSIYDEADYFMDFYNSICDSYNKSLYVDLLNVYPPASQAGLRLLNLAGDYWASWGCKPVRDSNLIVSLVLISVILYALVVASSKSVSCIKISNLTKRLSAISIAALSCSYPPVVFMTLRLNTLSICLVLILACYAFTDINGKTSLNLYKIGLFACAIVKTYFILPLILLVAITASSRIRGVLAAVAVTIAYSIVNQLPFWTDLYEGNILYWLNNTLNFQANTAAVDRTNLWHFSYYSISLRSILNVYPHTSIISFLMDNSLDVLPKYRVFAKLMDGSMGIIVMVCILNSLRRLFVISKIMKIENALKLNSEPSLCYNSILRLDATCIATMPVLLLAMFKSDIGFYAASLIIPFLIAAVPFMSSTILFVTGMTMGALVAATSSRFIVGNPSIWFWVFSSFLTIICVFVSMARCDSKLAFRPQQ